MRKPKTSRQKLILANDNLFRQIIRIRDDYTCQKSGRKNVVLDVAHFWRRNMLRIRWDEDNACCLQKGLHRFWAHSCHQEFRDFWLKRLGQKKFDMLEIKARYVSPIKEADLLFIHYSLKKRLQEFEKKTGAKNVLA